MVGGEDGNGDDDNDDDDDDDADENGIGGQFSSSSYM